MRPGRTRSYSTSSAQLVHSSKSPGSLTPTGSSKSRPTALLAAPPFPDRENPMPDVALPKVEVFGCRMAYRAMGRYTGPVVLFLHGNPTSSYIWRDIMPIVSEVAYCIAPDLIGFGQSDKPDITYRFADHITFLDGFLDEIGIEEAWIVAQDWGTALAFELAWRRPSFIKGLGFMEFIRPMPTWDDFHQVPRAREQFKKFRTPQVGEQLIVQQNAFVEKVLPGSILRRLSDDEMDVYRAPFRDEN